MSEYLVKASLGIGTFKVPIKKAVRGVYADQPITIGWDYNGEVGAITTIAGLGWQPSLSFEPGPTSKLVITTTTPTNVTIRME